MVSNFIEEPRKVNGSEHQNIKLEAASENPQVFWWP
jgi:hypothetical protein